MKEDNDTLVEVENVSKKFSRNLKKSLFFGFQDIVYESLFIKRDKTELRDSEFWAVQDINFNLKRGECLGLIGRNGAGKSTLLKVLTGLVQPDKGTVKMNGKVAALIELGAGFNPILTGKENIYINGAVLGFTKLEMNKLFDDIVEFSELKEFIDTPVQYYSSGMKVRLGFSIAVNLKPDILILDEVLAVGDAGFKVKSFNRITEMIKNAAVIFVSHSMPNISRICNKVLLLTDGKAKYYGEDTGKGIGMYFDLFNNESSNIEFNEGAEIVELRLNNEEQPLNLVHIKFDEYIQLSLKIKLKSNTKRFHINLQIIDKDLKIVSQFISNKFHSEFNVNDDIVDVAFRFDNLRLIDGEYTISFSIIDDLEKEDKKYKILAIYRNFAKFKVSGLQESLYASHFLMGEVEMNGKKLSVTRN